MIKHVNGLEISKKLNSKCRVFVKHFSGAGTRCMEDYIKPLLGQNSQHFILHAGTNEPCTERSPEIVAKSILNLASTLKSDSHDVSVSNIFSPGRKHQAA